MAKTIWQIELDYKRAVRQGKQLLQLAGKLEQMEPGLQDILVQLENAWTGEAADTFRKKGMAAKAEMTLQAAQIRATARLITKTAENTRRAEIRALQIAERERGSQ